MKEFTRRIQNSIREFEKKFSTTHRINPQKVINTISIKQFNPTQIEKLRPLKFRLWLENVSPDILNREIRFWTVPISITAGFMSIKLKLPIGLHSSLESMKSTQSKLSNEAILLINEYLFENLNKFVYDLNFAYEKSLDEFIDK